MASLVLPPPLAAGAVAVGPFPVVMAVTRGGGWSEETLVWQLGAGLRAASCSFPHPFLLLTLLGIWDVLGALFIEPNRSGEMMA